MPTLTYIGSITSGGSVNIGTAASDCLVVVCVQHVRSSPGGRSISAVTIAGSAATINAQVANNVTSGAGAGIASRIVTTGGSISISWTLSGAVTDQYADVYTVTGLSSATPFATGTANGNNPSATVNYSAGGVAIGTMVGGDGGAPATCTWTGLNTTDSNTGSTGHWSSAHSTGVPAETAHSVSVASSASNEVVVLATWQAAATAISITGDQTIPAFTQSATLTVNVAVAANQTIPAFGQSATITVEIVATASQTIPAFAQSANLIHDVAINAVADQTIPAFSQSATLTVECVISVNQTIPDFSQAAFIRRGDVTPGLIFRGAIGQCSINRSGLATLEARSILTLGRGFLSERFCQQCRADLYDARCKVVKESFSASATVASVSGQFKFTVTTLPDARATGTWYDLGQAVITSGTGEGTPFQIKTWTSGTLTVEAMTPIDELLDVGDTLTLYAGCNKSSTTCRDKFSNMINYRGEEYAAGRDLQLTTTGS